jgi:hypothetical protein
MFLIFASKHGVTNVDQSAHHAPFSGWLVGRDVATPRSPRVETATLDPRTASTSREKFALEHELTMVAIIDKVKVKEGRFGRDTGDWCTSIMVFDSSCWMGFPFRVGCRSGTRIGHSQNVLGVRRQINILQLTVK